MLDTQSNKNDNYLSKQNARGNKMTDFEKIIEELKEARKELEEANDYADSVPRSDVEFFQL